MKTSWLVRLFKRRAKRAVYTCMFGHSEHFNDFHYKSSGVDFICFTDDPDLTSSFWDVRVLPQGSLDPARKAKQVKALAHQFLPEYEESLYVDNTVRLKIAPCELFDRYLSPSPSPMVCFRHPWRDCIYDEAEVVLELGYDAADIVRCQMAIYRSLNYPAHHGLTKCGFILRRHNEPALARVMERWHQEVLHHSKRDQLSLNFVLWSENFSIGHLPGKFTDFEFLDWPVMKNDIRLPRDFDEARYRELNPDVTMDGGKHFLLHGAAENRRYK